MFTATTGPDGERGGATSTRRRRRDGPPPRHPAALRPPRQPVRALRGAAPARRGALRRRPRAPRGRQPVRHRARARWRSTSACRSRRPSTASSTARRRLFRAVGHLARWAGRGVALSSVSSMAAAAGLRRRRWRRRSRSSPTASTSPGGVAGARGADRPVGRPAGRLPVHVVTATRLASRKRPLALLAVLRWARALLDPAVPLRATVVGEGPQRRVLERYVARPRPGLGRAARSGRPRRAAPAAPRRRRLPHRDAARGVRHRRARGARGRAARARAARHRRRRLRARRRRGPARPTTTPGSRRPWPASPVTTACGRGLRQHVRTVPPAQDWDGRPRGDPRRVPPCRGARPRDHRRRGAG